MEEPNRTLPQTILPSWRTGQRRNCLFSISFFYLQCVACLRDLVSGEGSQSRSSTVYVIYSRVPVYLASQKRLLPRTRLLLLWRPEPRCLDKCRILLFRGPRSTCNSKDASHDWDAMSEVDWDGLKGIQWMEMDWNGSVGYSSVSKPFVPPGYHPWVIISLSHAASQPLVMTFMKSLGSD